MKFVCHQVIWLLDGNDTKESVCQMPMTPRSLSARCQWHQGVCLTDANDTQECVCQMPMTPRSLSASCRRQQEVCLPVAEDNKKFDFPVVVNCTTESEFSNLQLWYFIQIPVLLWSGNKLKKYGCLLVSWHAYKILCVKKKAMTKNQFDSGKSEFSTFTIEYHHRIDIYSISDIIWSCGMVLYMPLLFGIHC